MSEDVFVLTGGAGGMARETASLIAGRGRLLLLDLSDEALASTAGSLSALGADVEVMRCDVTSVADTQAAAQLVRTMGRFRALIHTAGVSPEMADARTVLDVDLAGTVRITDAFAPLVVPGTAAVLVASIAGATPLDPAIETLLDEPLSPQLYERLEAALGAELVPGIAYAIAKRGVVRLAERLARPWGASGGRIVSILPGLINTEMGRFEMDRQPVMAAMAAMTPVRRDDTPLPGEPHDIAELCAFLVSDAASFISGCDIRVDGGLIGSIRHPG